MIIDPIPRHKREVFLLARLSTSRADPCLIVAASPSGLEAWDHAETLARRMLYRSSPLRVPWLDVGRPFSTTPPECTASLSEHPCKGGGKPCEGSGEHLEGLRTLAQAQARALQIIVLSHRTWPQQQCTKLTRTVGRPQRHFCIGQHSESMQVRAQVSLSGQASCSGSCLQRLGPKSASLAASRPVLHYARPQRLSQRVCAEGEKGEGRDEFLCYRDDDGMADCSSYCLNQQWRISDTEVLACPTGGLGGVLDKVKGALGLEDEEIDENILEYCSLDPAVSFLSGGPLWKQSTTGLAVFDSLSSHFFS